MPERSSKRRKRDHDFGVNTFHVTQEAIQEDEEVAQAPPEEIISQESGSGKNPNAVALGRLGGKKGGKARAVKLAPEQRSEIAKKAAAARWGNRETT